MMQGGIVMALISIALVIVSIIIHEVSHGYMAYALGDDTAYRAGRLSANPLRHIDWLGSVILPLGLALMGSPVMFGWAKPVPINTRALTHRYGPAFVSIAGPLSNIIVAAILALVIRFTHGGALFESVMVRAVMINSVLACFNMIPIPPLDGYHIVENLLPDSMARAYRMLERYQIFLVLLVIFFADIIIRAPAFALMKLFIGA